MALIYDAPQTCAQFMVSEAYGRLIAGPVGSGKTTACIIELLRRSIMQSPAPDGYRYTRFAVVRQTLKQLKDTVLRDCDTWLGANGLGYWKVSEGIYHVQFDDVRSEWVFIPLEDATDQARLLSMQLTGSWLSECIEMNLNILGPVSGRLGRYPSGARGNPSWFGIIADTNLPTEMSEWHTFMENMPPAWSKFIQPSGMSPLAENLNFLTQTDATVKLPLDHPVRIAQGRKYYSNLVDTYGENSDWVKRYVYAQYGDDPSGAAVFKNTFKSDFHIVPDTEVIPGYPILLCQDFGRNPWTLICQPDHMGRLLVHAEVRASNIGLEKHVETQLRPALMSNKFIGQKFMMVGDPAGRAKGTIAEESCFDALKRLGFPAMPAPTNDIEPRLRAVEAMLGRQVNGGPALVISRVGAPHLCRAMSGGYRFTAKKTGALRVVPDKDDKEGYSHVADCLQYGCLIVHGGMMPYVFEALRPPPASRPAIPAGAWT
jgi:hypothetical protein